MLILFKPERRLVSPDSSLIFKVIPLFVVSHLIVGTSTTHFDLVCIAIGDLQFGLGVLGIPFEQNDLRWS